MNKLISDAFKTFKKVAPVHANCWQSLIEGLSLASALDKKTHSLAFLSVLAVLRRENGIPYHVQLAKKSGASREEIISAILVGLPPAGHVVTEVLHIAVKAFDEDCINFNMANNRRF